MAGILDGPRELSGKHRDEFSHHSLANLSESGGIDCERHQRYIPTSEKKTAEHGKTSEKSPRTQRTRKIPVRPKSLRHTRRKVGDAPGASALARLVDALAAEGIRFQFVGMTAAILQGVPATTLDTDIWLELPERRYIQALDIAKKLSAEILARTVVALKDDTLVNFLYRIDGLKPFKDEYESAEVLEWFGREIRVLPLRSIIASKKHIRRPKDLAHLPLLRQTLKLLKQPTG